VNGGDIFGYLGPNGAGKTTTLRIILGLVRPSQGEVHVFSRRASEAAGRIRLGSLPGEFRLYGDMTGQSLLEYFANYRPKHPPVLRAALLQALNLEAPLLAKKVKFLSHGEKQKIGLTIAMQHDPELLLLDEPTSGLDPLVQKAFREIILDFARRGRAVFFSSHVLSEVEAICNRVAILRAGELVALETVENLRTNMVRRVHVRLRGAAPEDLAGLPGVTQSQVSGSDVTLWVQGDINPILRRLATLELESFSFPEPELEDIFMSYYLLESRRDG
jgi:ABC-2 type transport system ATP-binding protein